MDRLSSTESIVERFSKCLTSIEYPKVKSSWNIAGILKSRNAFYKYDVRDMKMLSSGEWVKSGTHTDFIGNHHADKRECDTELIKKSKVYADSRVNAFKEAGEILVPISEGEFTEEDVVAELSEMCRGKAVLRESDEEITLFKSIGMAMSDLVGAGLAYNNVIKQDS